MTETLTCAFEPCSKEFVARRAHARFCSDACRSLAWKANASDDAAERVLDHPLDIVRGDAEESDEKARWTLIVREQIARTLHHTGYFSVDDLDALGIPPEHVNVCTSQIGSFASARHMRKLHWTRSEKTSRKGGIKWTFQITETGREKLPGLLEDVRAKLAGLDAENPEGTAGSNSPTAHDPAPSTDRGLSMGVPRGAGSSFSVQSGESTASTSGAPISDADSPDHLFDSEAVHITKQSAYSAENEYA